MVEEEKTEGGLTTDKMYFVNKSKEILRETRVVDDFKMCPFL